MNRDKLQQMISATRLTKKESLVAEYLINNLNTICFMSASELARTLDVSDTTVNRTVKTLGYSTFLSFQAKVQQSMLNQSKESFFLPPSERLNQEIQDKSVEQYVLRLSEVFSENANSVFERNSQETIEAAINMLLTSKTKYICGQRPTIYLAERFGVVLRMIIENVRIVSGSYSFEQVLDITPDDCLFVIDFNRYSKNADRQIQYAREKGSKVILLTDRPTAPFARFADVVLVVNVLGLSFFNSGIAPLMLLEYICSRLTVLQDKKVKERLAGLDPYFDSFRLQS